MKTILVTGATGFLGGAVVAELLKMNEKSHILLLVRSTSLEQGLERIRENLSKHSVTTSLIESLSCSNIILGDLAAPEVFCEDPRIEAVTHVINCAAIASFGNNPNIWKVNVEGTFFFAARMSKVKKLENFLHVGTAMSCAPERNMIVPENISETKRDQHIVEYTWSKAIIERMILEDLPELPFVIARPSIVIGHSEYGCLPSASIFWVFKMVIMLGEFMCNLSDKIDIIPVDYCARSLIKILFNKGLNRDVVHVSAGVEGSVTFAEIDKAIASASGNEAISNNYKKISLEEIVSKRSEFKKIYGPCNERLLLKAFYLYGYFSELNVIFDNTKLLNLGMEKPVRFIDYIDKCCLSTQGSKIQDLMQVDFK